MVEDVEIKIEYIDTNETDPLNEFQNHESKTKFTSENEEKSNIWQNTIDNNGRLICKFCDLKYSTTQTLRHHIKTKHPNLEVSLKKYTLNNKRNCKHICHICKTNFVNVNELKKHVNTSHVLHIISLSCLYCDATFVNTNELSNHMFLEHNKVCEIFTCDICGYRTTKKSHFIKHTKTHLPDKKIPCKYCDYSTDNLANLKVHEHIHTNSKPYGCDFGDCKYQSCSKSGLRSHRLKHFRESNTLYCEKCSYSTVYKNSLKRHLESHNRSTLRDM